MNKIKDFLLLCLSAVLAVLVIVLLRLLHNCVVHPLCAVLWLLSLGGLIRPVDKLATKIHVYSLPRRFRGRDYF